MKDQDIKALITLSERMLDSIKLQQLFLSYLSVEDYHKNILIYDKIVKQSEQQLESIRKLVTSLKSHIV